MKRIFVFSYHGEDNYQTSYYRLLSISQRLAKDYEVYFVHGTTKNVTQPINLKNNLIELSLDYNHGFFQNLYNLLLNKNRKKLAKILLIVYFLFTGKEIFDLGKEFFNYIEKTNLYLNNEDKIFVSYPSLAIHNLGNSLKRKFKSKLILDYRDPGVFGYQQVAESKFVYLLRRYFLKRRELRNIQNADMITVTHPILKEVLPAIYHNKVHIIRNGFLANKTNLALIVDIPKIFNIVYLGTLYDIQLEDKSFFKAVRKFIDANNVLPHQFQLKFIGGKKSVTLTSIIKKYQLDPYTLITDRLPIEVAYQYLYKASIFLHLKYGDRKSITTSKQYEYFAFQKPVLLPIDDKGDIAQSIRTCNCGYICNSIDEIVNVLNEQYKLYLNGTIVTNKKSDEEVLKLSRQYQEEKLINLIKNL